MRSMREADAVATPSPVRTPRPAVVAAWTSGPIANTARIRCTASSRLCMIWRLAGSLVDATLHRRGPEAGVPLLQLRDLPVVALDHLAAPVGLAVAHQDELGIVDVQRVVGGELLVGGDVHHRDELAGRRPPHVRRAAVVERPDLDRNGGAG